MLLGTTGQTVNREAAAAEVFHLDIFLGLLAIVCQLSACRMSSKTSFHKVQAFFIVIY
ncbi:hypothetical protein D3C86_1907320 [compost metagenome]